MAFVISILEKIALYFDYVSLPIVAIVAIAVLVFGIMKKQIPLAIVSFLTCFSFADITLAFDVRYPIYEYAPLFVIPVALFFVHLIKAND